MKWQHFEHEGPDGMTVDLTLEPLEKLYQMLATIENRLTDLRASKPSPKRKNTKKYSEWFAVCQVEINRQQEIRDAIIAISDQRIVYA